MNKAAIKNYAIWARNKLISDVSYRAGLMGITADGIKSALPQSTGQTEFYDIGTSEPYAISGKAIKQRQHLVDRINKKASETNYASAYKYVIEEVAYTWFNRLIAVRFMEVNDYLPSHVRVLSSDSGKTEPDLVTNPFDADLDFSDKEKQLIIDYKNENKLDELFCMLFIKQCNSLNNLLPALFEKTDDYTELLLNISAIDKDGVVYRLVNDIPEEDFDIKRGGQVEIIGWLYQYYNTEPKDEAFDRDEKITKEELPAVTQLFTPDWIVRYMVENSLGRMWIEGHPNELLKSTWKYYLESAEQEPDVQLQLDAIQQEYSKLKPEEIKVIDPCMGSGHILVYAFDVLMQIYESVGYSSRDAARSILENNIYGLDIDDRAYQMAYFAVMMKARQYNRRILSNEVTCHLYSIQESNNINRKHLVYFGNALRIEDKEKALNQITNLLDIFIDAKEYGSILTVANYDWTLLRSFANDNNDSGQMSLEAVGLSETQRELLKLIDISEVMARKYDCVITNPPYMGNGKMSAALSLFAKDNYPESKSDLFAIFIEKSLRLLKCNGITSLITQHAWMFLSTFESLRNSLEKYNLINMAHLGLGAFPDLNSKVIQSVAFCFRNSQIENYVGNYNRLFEKEGVFEDTKKKSEWLVSAKHRFFCKQKDFDAIPGKPIVYWASDTVLYAFKSSPLLSDICEPKQGVITGDNELFLRAWHEVSATKTAFIYDTNKKWYPINKGGDYRRWYGNKNFVINWENDGFSIRNFKDSHGKLKSRPQNLNWNFKKGISWSLVTTAGFSARYYDENCMFNVAGITCFPDGRRLQFLLALLNSVVIGKITKMLNPTINMNAGDVARIPIVFSEDTRISELCVENISISKKDWDSFESSWDFKKHPLV